jgi:hypothetical protein
VAVGSGVTIEKTVWVNNIATVTNESLIALTMHRGVDGLWRIGPRFPQNPRQVQAMKAKLLSKDEVLRKAISELSAGNIKTVDEAMEAVRALVPTNQQ